MQPFQLPKTSLFKYTIQRLLLAFLIPCPGGVALHLPGSDHARGAAQRHHRHPGEEAGQGPGPQCGGQEGRAWGLHIRAGETLINVLILIFFYNHDLCHMYRS